MNDAEHGLVLGTAGHIDHGKTALVRALTGVDTDRLPAEKQRGITIDLGFAPLRLGEYQLALVDVPGHERFIRNMLAGASGLDLAMLVVAADDSVMPQTREHLEILRLLGLAGGVVAITKCDLADPRWLELVQEEVRALVRGTFLENSPIVATSTATGQGLDELKDALKSACATAKPAQDHGFFRMAIDRSFTVAGHGTVVTGTVASGTVTVGDDVEWQPAGRVLRVRGLQRHDRPVGQIGRGSRAAINLAGIHHGDVQRGQELASPGYAVATQMLTVEVARSHEAVRPLHHRGRYKLHLGTAEISAVLALMEDGEVAAGVPQLAQLFTARPVVAVHGEPFVLRAESPPATLGGGRVIQPWSRRHRRRDRVAIERLERLRSEDGVVRLRAALTFFGLTPWTEPGLCAAAGLAREQVGPTLAALAASGALLEIPVGPKRTVRVVAELVVELEERAIAALGRLHAAHPRQSMIPRTQLTTALPGLTNESLAAGLIDRLKAQGKIVGDSRAVALSGFEPKLSQGERKLKNELREAIRAGGFSPPEGAELAAIAGARGPVVAELLALLRDDQQVVEITSNLFLDYELESELRRRVTERLADGSTITMSELRGLLESSRKYAVPIGEYLDRIGLTAREGDVRRLRSAGASEAAPPVGNAE